MNTSLNQQWDDDEQRGKVFILIMMIIIFGSLMIYLSSCEKQESFEPGDPGYSHYIPSGKKVVEYEVYSGGNFPSITYKDDGGHKNNTTTGVKKVVDGITWYYKKDTIHLLETSHIWIEAIDVKCQNIKLIISVNYGEKTELQDDCSVLFKK